MASLKTLLIVYILGGLTFVPLLLLLAFLTLPRRDHVLPSSRSPTDTLIRSEDEASGLKSSGKDLPEKLKQRSHEPDVSAGYFAVCREYVPGGVNGKPPERTTPAGETIAAESPSVYQSMYRSIFDRNKVPGPTITEGAKTVKKAKNVFYVVLRHAHLLLFDDSEQLDVRFVIALAHYDVNVYAGGNEIPEGELWIKRNCIRLTRKDDILRGIASSAPFYLFSDNCSEKEDFYHALLHSQERGPDAATDPPRPLGFEMDDIIKLVRQIHASEENLHSRWINAVVGRLFLALYRTPQIEEMVRLKITKKMARVSKPAFITSLHLQEIDMGDSAPIFTNPKLREMTVDGDLTVEADIRYNGSFKLQIAAVARIELGSRFKAREVDLVLASIFKKLDGHMLFRIKPPPSNRIWFTFENMPKTDINIEPIVSSRQITYGVILRAIESRIKEVMSDTIIMPNWDDIPFTHTLAQDHRGGIWKSPDTSIAPSEYLGSDVAQKGMGDDVDSTTEDDDSSILLASEEKMASMPELNKTSQHSIRSRRKPDNPYFAASSATKPITYGHESDSRTGTESDEKPKALWSNSFATAAIPVISRGSTTTDTIRQRAKKKDRDAATAMKILSDKSPMPSPPQSPVGSSPPRADSMPLPREKSSLRPQRSWSVTGKGDLEITEQGYTDAEDASFGVEKPLKSNTEPLVSSNSSSREDLSAKTHPSVGFTQEGPHMASSISPSPDRRKPINQSITSATAAAKKWGWNVINRQNEAKSNQPAVEPSEFPKKSNKPVGRGQPLPPPGVPLPNPERSGWSVAALNTFKKRSETIPKPQERISRKPLGERTLRQTSLTPSSLHMENAVDDHVDTMLVVSAPTESTPTTPTNEWNQHEVEQLKIDASHIPEREPLNTAIPEADFVDDTAADEIVEGQSDKADP